MILAEVTMVSTIDWRDSKAVRDLCVQTDGAWWKLKKYCQEKELGNYPDGWDVLFV